MQRFRFSGDICRPATVVIEAEDRETAIKRAQEGEFDEIENEDRHDGLAFFRVDENLQEEEVGGHEDRKSTRLNSSHYSRSRMPSSA